MEFDGVGGGIMLVVVVEMLRLAGWEPVPTESGN